MRARHWSVVWRGRGKRKEEGPLRDSSCPNVCAQWRSSLRGAEGCVSTEAGGLCVRVYIAGWVRGSWFTTVDCRSCMGGRRAESGERRA